LRRIRSFANDKVMQKETAQNWVLVVD